MREYLLVATAACLIWAPVAFAADKTVHDGDSGFSLTFPEDWSKETPFGDTMRLKVKSGDHGLTCRVSVDLYDTSTPDSPADPKAFIEKQWSLENWQETVGPAFTSAVFSNEKLVRFPDGYPARMADMDFRLEDGNSSFPGHAKVAFSMRGARYGLVTCGLLGDTVEQTKQMWAPLADQAERVVSSFVLDSP